MVAYKDNSSVIEGAKIERFYPAHLKTRGLRFHEEDTHIIMKVETHNHPTAIAPLPARPPARAVKSAEMKAPPAKARAPKPASPALACPDLNIPGAEQPWERSSAVETPYGKPERIASPLDIMIEGPLAAPRSTNGSGRPNLMGSPHLPGKCQGQCAATTSRSMIAGGLGTIQAEQTLRIEFPAGSLLIQLGGPGMLISWAAALLRLHGHRHQHRRSGFRLGAAR